MNWLRLSFYFSFYDFRFINITVISNDTTAINCNPTFDCFSPVFGKLDELFFVSDLGIILTSCVCLTLLELELVLLVVSVDLFTVASISAHKLSNSSIVVLLSIFSMN